MKTLIVANWKMNPLTEKEAVKLFDKIKKGIKSIKNLEIVICPPFIYISSFRFQDSRLTLGAQNVFYKERGAFTGEISPTQLKDLAVEYVIVGHSEVRKYLNETDEIVNKKVKECLAVGLKPILCVGENVGENKKEVLRHQLKSALKNVSSSMFNAPCIIAYEPVWAIGTGNNCSTKETKSTVLFIRKIIQNLYNKELADNTKILYGGSVSSKNSADYIKNTGVNGLLVGGNSLNADDFIKIIKLAIPI